MEVEKGLIIGSVCGASVTTIILVNSIVYFSILNFKNNNKLNIFIQFLGLVFCHIYQLDCLLANFGFLESYPELRFSLPAISWFIFYNSYFLVFIKQSDILLPRKLYLGSIVYMVILSGIAIFDLYCFYMALIVDPEAWTNIAGNMDLVMCSGFVIIESFINFYIIGRIFYKTRNMNNSHYKQLVRKLAIVLTLYFFLDAMILVLDNSVYQPYSYLMWGVSYSIKTQTETLCLGKIRECIIIMESYENS